MTTGLTDLRKLERDAFRRFYDDGLLDVYLGAMLILMGATAVATDRIDDFGYSAWLVFGLAMAVTIPLLVYRRRLLRTRLGTFQPSGQRRQRIKGARLFLLGSVVVGILMFGVAAAVHAGGASEDVLGAAVPLVWFVNAVVVLGAAGYFLDVPRFYFHGVVWGLAMPLLIWPDLLWDYQLPPWLALGLPGATIAGVGVFKLVHFLRDYPAPSPTEFQDG
jgi:hypothetical protein